MKWTDIPAGTKSGAEQRLWVALGNRAGEVATQINTDPPFLSRVAQFMLNRGLTEPVDIRLLRYVLGSNLYGPFDWTSQYNLVLTKKQLRAVAQFPWSEEVLNSPCPFNPGKLIKDTHFAFLGVQSLGNKKLTILGWHELHPFTDAEGRELQPRFYFHENPWYAKEGYAKDDTLEFRWYLILKDIVPNSTGKLPDEQVAMLPKEYEIPTSIAEVTKDLLVFRKTGARPNPKVWARCREKTSSGRWSCVGYFDSNGLNVYDWGGYPYGRVGVGAARKSEARSLAA